MPLAAAYTFQVVSAGGEAAHEPGTVSINTLELELETGRPAIVDVQDFPIIRHWYVLQRKGKRLSRAAQAFKKLVPGQAAQFIRPPK